MSLLSVVGFGAGVQGANGFKKSGEGLGCSGIDLLWITGCLALVGGVPSCRLCGVALRLRLELLAKSIISSSLGELSLIAAVDVLVLSRRG